MAITRRGIAGAGVGLLLAAAAMSPPAHAAGGGNTRILFGSDRDGNWEVYSARPDGTDRVDLTRNPANDNEPRLSPDGRRIVFISDRSGRNEIWMMRADGTQQHQLTTLGGEYPGWISTSLISFESDRDGPRHIFRMNADGTRQIDLTPANPEWAGGGVPSPDGTRIAFESNSSGQFHLYTVSVDGGPLQQITRGAGEQIQPAWSPDGTQLSFAARTAPASGWDLWASNVDGSGLRQLTATPDLTEGHSVWSPNGRRILFVGCTGGGGPDGQCQEYMMPSRGGAASNVSMPSTFADRLNDDWRDPFWYSGGQGTGGHAAEANGHLEETLDADSVPDQFNAIQASYSSPCLLSGDFDMRASYTLLDWPQPANGVIAWVNAWSPDVGTVAAMQRESNVWNEGYSTFFPSGGTAVPSNDQSGAMRLVRSGLTATAYYRAGRRWVEIGSAIVPTVPAVPALSLLTFGDRFAHQQVRVAWSNFSVKADALICPASWQDNWGDWRAAPG